MSVVLVVTMLFFKQKTAYEMRISDWSSDVCSSDLGYKPGGGVDERILAGSLDPENRRGSRTRLLRFQPGVFTTTPFVHDYWEEVFLLSGDLTVGNDEQGNGG